MTAYLMIFIVNYLLGLISSAVLVTRLWKKADIRTLGDGNAGTANVARSVGIAPAALVAIFDLSTGSLPVLVVRGLGLSEGGAILGAVATIIGHNFPLYFRFKGGRGLATSLGGLLALSPISALAALPVYGIVYFASLGSGILATLAAFPLMIVMNYWQGQSVWVIWSPLIMAVVTFLCSLPERLSRWVKLEDKRIILNELFPAYAPRRTASRSTAIITDSIPSLPCGLAQREGIHIVPMSLVIGEKLISDDADINLNEFYEGLQSGSVHPTTAAPSPAEFYACFESLANNHRDGLVVSPPENLTQCYNAARLAAEQIADRFRVEVIDSGVAGLAQGLMALLAARLAS